MKKALVWMICIILVISVAFVSLLTLFFKEDVLSNEEVELLRAEYPYYDETLPDVSMTATVNDIRKVVKKNDTFIYCEVMGEPLIEEVYIMSGVPEIDEKLYKDIEQGFLRYQYPVKIISDTEGIFQKGQEISFCYGIIFQEYSPSPKAGDKIIIPISVGLGENEGIFFSDAIGYYSVTEKGYVMSAFKENSTKVYSGKKADNLMKTLVKTDEELSFYKELKKYEFDIYYGEENITDITAFKAKVTNELVPKNRVMIESLKELTVINDNADK